MYLSAKALGTGRLGRQVLIELEQRAHWGVIILTSHSSTATPLLLVDAHRNVDIMVQDMHVDLFQFAS